MIEEQKKKLLCDLDGLLDELVRFFPVYFNGHSLCAIHINARQDENYENKMNFVKLEIKITAIRCFFALF